MEHRNKRPVTGFADLIKPGIEEVGVLVDQRRVVGRQAPQVAAAVVDRAAVGVRVQALGLIADPSPFHGLRDDAIRVNKVGHSKVPRESIS